MQSRHSHILPLSFNGDPNQLTYTLDRFLEYAITLVQKKEINFCYIGTASEDDPREDAFFNAYAWANFSKVGHVTKLALTCNLTHEEIKNTLLTQDIIFVGGGNTNFMLYIWEKTGFKAILNELKSAKHLPSVIMGLSAGGIFPFEGAISLTADKKEYEALLTGYDWIKGSFNPHSNSDIKAICTFDKNTMHDRMSAFVSAIKTGALKPGYAVPDDCMLHFCDSKYVGAFSARENIPCYYVTKNGVDAIDTVFLKRDNSSNLAKNRLGQLQIKIDPAHEEVQAYQCRIF